MDRIRPRVAALGAATAVFVLASAIVLAGPASAARAPAALAEQPLRVHAAPVRYRPPVDAPVRDPFRAPDGPYAAGNRGIEYDTTRGAPVVAPGDGTVAFSGVVARERWVSILHADGLRSTVGPLSDTSVVPGQRVAAGEQVGRADGPLLFTLRRGDSYIDPAEVLDGADPRVHLAKLRESTPGGPSLPSLGDLAPLLVDAAALASGASGWVWLPVWSSPMLVDPGRLAWDAGVAVRDWWVQRSSCTAASVPPPPPPGRRVAVLVAGLGSSSTSASIDDLDVGALGYASGDVIRFSYRGGRIPGEAAGELGAIEVSTYAQGDTLGDLEVAASRLAEVIVAAAEALPANVPVDVMAHSQGGLVTRLALEAIERNRPELLPRLGLVVTFASPHHGAPLAGGAVLAAGLPVLGQGLDEVERFAGTGLDPRSAAVRQLAPGSDVIAELDGLRPPPGVRVISIAARGDVVVPVPRTQIDGATNLTVEVGGLNDHSGLPGSPAAVREVALGLAGLDPTCVGLLTSVLGAVSGSAVDQLEGGAAG